MTADELRQIFEEIWIGFGQLEERIETVLNQLNMQGAAAFKKGEHAGTSKILAQAQRIVSLMGNLKQSRDEWQKIFEGMQLRPPKENPLPLPPPNLPPVRPRRGRTPEPAFRKPILEALVELGGSGSVQEVLDRVEARMADRLTEYDRKLLPAGYDIRWRNTAQWARYRMVQEGLLARKSRRGIWEITELGRRELLRL